MSHHALRPYTDSIRTALEHALCIQAFPCQQTERHNKAEIELQDSPELLLPPVQVARGDKEKCLIEASVNSVRVSLLLNKADLLEEALTRTYMRCVCVGGGGRGAWQWCLECCGVRAVVGVVWYMQGQGHGSWVME